VSRAYFTNAGGSGPVLYRRLPGSIDVLADSGRSISIGMVTAKR